MFIALTPPLRSMTCHAQPALPWRFAAAAIALAGTLLSAPLRADGTRPPATQEISAAEKLLFTTDHLASIKGGTASLRYSFQHKGSLEPAFEDSVAVQLAPSPKGQRSATTRFLTGERGATHGPVEQPDGNPVLLHFLERDIREMERLTGGKPNYFRKRIRMALAEDAQVRAVKISVNGRSLEAQEVRITPYLNDPLKERFGKHVGKTYTFTLAQGVPGQLWQIHTRTPDPEKAEGPPLMEDTLRYEGSGTAATSRAEPAPRS